MTDLICNKQQRPPQHGEQQHGEDTCAGEVTYWTRPSDFKSFPKCAKHHGEAVTEFDRINQTYGLTSDVAPDWIDPTYAGEQW
jgi:hypothetical protein|tara:strand:+ start:254 stop:502 length:249 start_codon:yes stop_codon:yes gene_type:complete